MANAIANASVRAEFHVVVEKLFSIGVTPFDPTVGWPATLESSFAPRVQLAIRLRSLVSNMH